MSLLPARTPDVLRQLATDFDVVNNFAFLPHRRLIPAVLGGPPAPQLMVNGAAYVSTALLTLCNAYVAVFTAALGCPVPPMKANQQLTWLSSPEGAMAGWFSVNANLAVGRASLGYPTIVGAVEQPHGHIAMVMPSPATDSQGVYVSAAGIQNFVFDRLARSFGHLAPECVFFTHN